MRIRRICAAALFGSVLCGGTAIAATQKPAAKSTPAAKPANNTARPATGTKAVRNPSRPSPAELKTPGAHPLRDGGVIKTDAKGFQRGFDKTGHIRTLEAPGIRAHFNANGRPQSFHVERNGFSQTLHRGPGGVRVVEGVHPAMGGGAVRVVGYGPHRGFVERPIYGRYGYMRRSYLVGGRPYAVVYRGYRYHGLYFYRPVPALIYAPGYYGWAVSPWAAPASIQAGFVSQPWYGAYGETFAPYPVYASPDQWMTDQMLSSNMQQAYDVSRDTQGPDLSGYPPAVPPQISPELKQQIDDQVKLEVAEMGKAASGGPATLAPPATPSEPDEVPDALRPGHIAFRVVMPLSVEADGESCDLNTDDWILRTGDLQPDGTVPVKVATSRPDECGAGSTTNVSLNDLMTMQNEQDQQVMAVLKMAADTMGKSGMPAGPAGGSGATPFPGGTSSPDTDVATTLQKEQGEAASTENEVVATSTAGGL